MVYTRDAKCATCTDGTKQIAGFWEEFDDKLGMQISGSYYDCSNFDCPVKVIQMMSTPVDETLVASNFFENEKNRIDFEDLERYRRNKGIFLSDMCKVLEVDPSEYCAYRSGEKPVPNEFWRKALDKYNFLEVTLGKERTSY